MKEAMLEHGFFFKCIAAMMPMVLLSAPRENVVGIIACIRFCMLGWYIMKILVVKDS